MTSLKPTLLAIFLCCFCSLGHAQNRPLLELMVERLMNQQMPKVLLTANDVRWSGGKMNVLITKTGVAQLTEGKSDLVINLPIEALLKGGMKQNVGPLTIDMNCQVKFQSVAKVKLLPAIRNGKLVNQSDVKIPVPPVNADCDGMSLPASAALQLLIDQNTSLLEDEVNRTLENYLN